MMTTEQKRKDYYLKSNPVSVASKSVERKNYSQYFFEEVKSDPEPNPRSKNLIITVGAGPIGSLYKFSGPLMQDYSQKVGADFILLKGQTQKYWGNEKFRIRKYSSAYERILFFVLSKLIVKSSISLCCLGLFLIQSWYLFNNSPASFPVCLVVFLYKSLNRLFAFLQSVNKKENI